MWLIRESATHMVRGNNVMCFSEGRDQAPEIERPGGIAVKHDNRRMMGIPFIDKIVPEFADHQTAASKIVRPPKDRRQGSKVRAIVQRLFLKNVFKYTKHNDGNKHTAGVVNWQE